SFVCKTVNPSIPIPSELRRIFTLAGHDVCWECQWQRSSCPVVSGLLKVNEGDQFARAPARNGFAVKIRIITSIRAPNTIGSNVLHTGYSEQRHRQIGSLQVLRDQYKWVPLG